MIPLMGISRIVKVIEKVEWGVSGAGGLEVMES